MTAADYNTDFYLWTQQQAALLRRGRFSEVDTVHLIEEIEGMGGSERRALGSHLFNTVMHLLKWRYQPERQGKSWKLTIMNSRNAIERVFEYSPSLKPQLSAMVATEYRRARKQAVLETGLPPTTFPEMCPFTIEQITGDYWPD